MSTPVVHHGENATVTYSGGVNVFTFSASDTSITIGDLIVVALSCHASAGAFPSFAGWNQTVEKAQDATPTAGPQLVVYWKARAAGESNYSFSSATLPALDTHARGTMLALSGVKQDLSNVGVAEFDYGVSAGLPTDTFYGPETNIPIKKGDLLVKFVAVNSLIFNTADADGSHLSVVLNLTGPAEYYSNDFLETGASLVPATGFDDAGFGTFDVQKYTGGVAVRAFGVAIAFTLQPKRSNGLFGAATV